jgi:hypothetical protein
MRRSRTEPPSARAGGHPRNLARSWSALRSPRLLVSVALAGCTPAPASPAPARCPSDAVVIASQADVARLARCQTLHGVTIRSGGALDTSVLRALTTITGDLVIGPTVGVEDITLGELRVVEGAVHVVGNGLLQGLFLPRLERAGRLVVDGNVAITTLSLPRLAAVHGALRITDNASLELVDIPALAAIDGELVLTSDPKLTLVESGELRSVGRVELAAPRLSAELTDRLRALAP